VSPRPVPPQPSLATILPQTSTPDWRDPPDVAASERERERVYLDDLAKTRRGFPYALHSFFRDLLALSDEQLAMHGTADEPVTP